MKHFITISLLLLSLSLLKAQNNTTISKNTQEVSFYPNPVKNNLFIRYKNTQTKTKMHDINVINVLGQRVKMFSSSTKNSLNLSTLPRGLYFVRYSLDKKVFSYKFVKN